MGEIDLLYISTVGARSGARRTAPVARFEVGDGVRLVIASAGGQVHHPAWYLNVVAHPDEVEVEVAGVRHRVVAEASPGAVRAEAWRTITTKVPRFATCETKTDRPIPVLRLRSVGVVGGTPPD